MASSSSHENNSSKWSKLIRQYYPEALERTYVIPAVHFNRVPFTVELVPGTNQTAHKQSTGTGPPPNKRTRTRHSSSQPQAEAPPQVMWCQQQQSPPKRIQESDLRDDAAQARVVRNLKEMGRHRGEAMFVISQFDIKDYLNKSDYHAAISQLPRPSQLNVLDSDFDVLIIHRHRGVLIGEAKSVGHNHADLEQTQAKSDADVVAKVQKSLTQLDRLEAVVRHVVRDIAPLLTIRTTLFLPNVGRDQLQRVLAADPQLEQDACQSLGMTVVDAAQAARLCCCADDVSDRQSWWDVTPDVLTNLTAWWLGRMNSVDAALTEEMYLDIAARFVGPASTVRVYSCTPSRVEVRTEGQAVAELGRRLSCLALTPQQWDLLSEQSKLVYLTGPPGTGKSLVLVMVGVGWLQNNIDTYVVSTRLNAVAITTLIAKQMEKTARSTPSPSTVGTVHRRLFDFDIDTAALDRAVQELSAAALGGARIIMDEAIFDTSNANGRLTSTLVTRLKNLVGHGLHLWCAGVCHRPHPELKVEVLTTPIRSAPAVFREVQRALASYVGRVDDYSASPIPAHGDGLCARRLLHQGDAHTERWPVKCVQCGKDVAAVLHDLGVGVPGSGISYRDVFVLTRSDDLEDEVKNDAGVVTSQASGVVRGLREGGMPVVLLGWKDKRRDRSSWTALAEDVATATTDRITVAYWRYVQGLERKIVVRLPAKREGIDDDRSDEYIDASDRLHLVSRCTTQFVDVDVPTATATTSAPATTSTTAATMSTVTAAAAAAMSSAVDTGER